MRCNVAAVGCLLLHLLYLCTASLQQRSNAWRPLSARQRSNAPVHTLLVDNYDSYTYNLYQLLAVVNGRKPTVIYNDRYASWKDALKDLPAFDNIVISPGPGTPEVPKDIGIVLEILREQLELAKSDPCRCVPVLGVCLGHQAIAYAAGGRVIQAPNPVHGRLSSLMHSDNGVFRGVPQQTSVVRYHSLIASDLPKELEPTAHTEDGILMGLQHESAPVHGVQFHPESIRTAAGETMLRNFRDITINHYKRTLPSIRKHIIPRIPRTKKSGSGQDGSEMVSSYKAFIHRMPCTLPRRRLDELFSALYGGSHQTFWLDSSSTEGVKVGGTSARFSYMGAVHNMTRQSHALEYNGQGQLTLRYSDGRTETRNETLLGFLRTRIHSGASIEAVDITDLDCPTPYKLPFNFTGGYVGYLSYEMRHETSSNSHKQDDATSLQEEGSVPLSTMLFVDRFLTIDHATNTISLVQILPADKTVNDVSGWKEFVQQVSDALTNLNAQPGAAAASAEDKTNGSNALHPTRDKSQYLTDIHQCLDLISQGETYEVCLTNSFTIPTTEEPLDVYRKLRRLNPAPYSAFMRYETRSHGDKSRRLSVACSSPETFLRVSPDGVIESRPIKGTSKRGSTSLEDEKLARELHDSEKTQAENLMIVDLVRNDFGRVCRPGTVTVPKLMEIETYATVLQMVSTIRGQLREECTPIDAIAACFPGGSMTGAPKKRTMEIIHKLEHEPRGIYSGSLGFISLNGAVDMNIVIRTIVFNGSHATIGCGGAIVALSDALQEYEEMVLKANAVSRVFENPGDVTNEENSQG